MAPGPETTAVPEGELRLTVVDIIDANKVDEAMTKAHDRGTPAGQDAFEWVLKKENQTKAAQMLTGADYYYFPNAEHPTNPKKAVCVYRDDDGRFKRDSNFRTNVWNSFDRVVMIG